MSIREASPQLERFGVVQPVVRAWGVVLGLVGLCLLAFLLVAVVNPSGRVTALR